MLKSPDRSLIGAAGRCALCAFAGLAAGLLLCRWDAFEFQASIALGQIVQTCVLLLVFLLANHVYAKAHDSRKKRGEILVDMVGEIHTHVQQAHSILGECVDQEPIPIPMRRRLYSALRDYSNAVNELEQVLKHSGQSTEESGFEDLRQNREDYKYLVTKWPHPTSLLVERIAGESKLYSKIKSNLRKFQMDLAGRI